MFNNVKSLILSGVLVLGMAMPVFADSNCIINGAGSHNDFGEHVINLEDRISAAQIENLIRTINDKTYYQCIVETNKDGYGYVISVYQDLDGDNNVSKEDELRKLVEVIRANPNDKVGSDVDKGWGSTDSIISPETGDALALGGLAIAAVATSGLVLINKKNKNK